MAKYEEPIIQIRNYPQIPDLITTSGDDGQDGRSGDLSDGEDVTLGGYFG